MKKIWLGIVVLLAFNFVAGCDISGSNAGGSVELTVVTPFSDSDGNRNNFVNAYKAYEAASGNKIIDVETAAVNEEWKSRVVADFESGNEPDVIFYFTGADSDELIKNNKLVPISDIRKEFPDYASNMKESLMPVSTYDGRQYAVSVYGYWEGLFVNKKVLAECGVAVPGADYTWDQFIADCRVIKENGYTPIACSLSDVPHYWFEYGVFNNGSVASHNKIPGSAGDEIAKNWIAGLEDIKTLYQEGFFPENTGVAKDDETVMLMTDNKAAFLLDGSWKVGWFQEHAENIDDFTVTYVPSKGERKSTDAVGGFSMGYCITKKAWDDPKKREACVEFVKAMTTDEVVSSFGELTVTALKNGVISSGDLDSLAKSTLAMTKGCTAMVPAAQDLLGTENRKALFKDIIKIASGEITSQQAVESCIGRMQ